jgi:DNA-directed RNA polymerase I subunit RPA1
MPKLLFVGIVERVCRATVVREIPGISECFQVKDDSKKGEEAKIKVGDLAVFLCLRPMHSLIS